MGEVGRHHPAGGPGHHRPPDRGLSGRAVATHRARRRDAAPPTPAAGRAPAHSRAAGQARAPASGHSDGGQAEARGAGTRARRDRRRWPQGHRAPQAGRRLRLCPPRTQPRRLDGSRGQWPGGVQPAPPGRPPEPLQQRTRLLGPAGPAPFFRHPLPRKAASPHPPGPGRLDPGRAHSPLSRLPPAAGPEAHSGTKQGWGIYFFSPFLFFNKKN